VLIYLRSMSPRTDEQVRMQMSTTLRKPLHMFSPFIFFTQMVGVGVTGCAHNARGVVNRLFYCLMSDVSVCVRK
jgi:hypothetical protein